jgi:hypothetical protein
MARIVGTVLQLALFAAMLASTPARAQLDDHLKCFKITDSFRLKGTVDLDSAALGLEPGCRVLGARQYCVPVRSTIVSAEDDGAPVTPIALSGPNPGDRICYRVRCPQPVPPSGQVTDVFGSRTVEFKRAYTLCTPAVAGPPPPEPATSGGMCLTSGNAGDFILNCNSGGGYDVTSRVAPTEGSPALRILGIYESYPVSGQATVDVQREERVVLVLSAYESTHWTVTAAPGAVIERVILHGCEPQTATVPAGVPVQDDGVDGLGCGANEYPSTDADDLIAAAEQSTGLCLTSFHGCYEASQMVVPPAP